MSEKCLCIEYKLCQYTGIYQFVYVCQCILMSYCALGRAYICPSVNTCVLPLVVYPSTYITVRYIVVILLHGSETWALRKAEQDMLERTEMRMLRWMTMIGIKKIEKIRNEEI